MCISQCAFYQVLVPSACSINFPKQMIKPVGLKEHRMHVHMELMPIQCGFLGGTQSSARNGAGTFRMEHPPILVPDTHVHQLFLNFVVVHTQQSHQVWVWVLQSPQQGLEYECIAEFVDLSMRYGTQFRPFHHHVSCMLKDTVPRAARLEFRTGAGDGNPKLRMEIPV